MNKQCHYLLCLLLNVSFLELEHDVLLKVWKALWSYCFVFERNFFSKESSYQRLRIIPLQCFTTTVIKYVFDSPEFFFSFLLLFINNHTVQEMPHVMLRMRFIVKKNLNFCKSYLMLLISLGWEETESINLMITRSTVSI